MGPNSVQDAPKALVGLPLSVARRAADMRIFHFGQIREDGGGTVGQYALHVQCPWRIDGPAGIITGRSDLWEPVPGHTMPDSWEPGIADNVQDVRLGQLLGGFDAGTHSHVNTGSRLVVEQVQASALGNLDIGLSGGYRL
ncbi:MAG TPA: hypothetical protein VM536_11650, partial [Chloroflexia bacterium]|nr:hypothetical protein [Chloroflexia bacterium]